MPICKSRKLEDLGQPAGQQVHHVVANGTLYFKPKNNAPQSPTWRCTKEIIHTTDAQERPNSAKGPKHFNAASPALKRPGKSCLAAIGQRPASVGWMGCLTMYQLERNIPCWPYPPSLLATCMNLGQTSSIQPKSCCYECLFRHSYRNSMTRCFGTHFRTAKIIW